jgi:hypothetical protein
MNKLTRHSQHADHLDSIQDEFLQLPGCCVYHNVEQLKDCGGKRE